MQRFLQRHQDRIVGVLSGFDRLLFRGTLRSISYLTGMDKFLNGHGVLYKHFGPFAEGVSDKIKEHVRQFTEKHERPFHDLQSSSLSKEGDARTIMEQDRNRRGLVCVLSCVEPCQTFALRRDRESKRLVLTPARRTCLFLDFYFADREFGLMHVRLQMWMPMSIKMYDKQGSVLRIETTINNPRRFNVRRKATRHGQLVTAWFPIRKGVADTARRVEISRAANERYLEAIGVVGKPFSTRQMLNPVSERIVRKG